MASNFIIIADDYQALNDKIEEIKKGLALEEEVISYDLNEEGLYAVIDELNTISLFQQAKLVVVRNTEELLHKEHSGFPSLLKAMNDIQSENVLILVFMTAVDFNNSQFQSLKRFSSLFDVRIKNLNLEEYAKKQFEKDGFSVKDSVIKLLMGYCDGLTGLRSFIDQLECYKADQKEITEADVLKLLTPPLDDNIYSLIDAVLAKDKKRMLKGYKDLKLRSMQASMLVSLFINKFQEICSVNVLVKKGFNQAKIAELFNVSSGRAYYMVKNAKSYHLSEVKRHLDLLNELDYKIKTGKIDQNLGLELYFLN